MNYMTLGIHYPKPEHTEDLLRATKKIVEVARKQSGIVDTGAWLDKAQDRVIVLSLWESEAAAQAARPMLAPLVMELPFDQWERKPAERMINLTRVI
jgi:quinol monooxygenase YgiN